MKCREFMDSWIRRDSPSRISTPRGIADSLTPWREWRRKEGGRMSRKCRNSLRRGHNTRNFGISTGGCVTAQWNTLNGMRVPKANKVCYRLLHLGIRVCRSIHACNPFQIICIVFQLLFQRLIFLGESGDESIDVRVGTDTKMFIE